MSKYIGLLYKTFAIDIPRINCFLHREMLGQAGDLGKGRRDIKEWLSSEEPDD